MGYSTTFTGHFTLSKALTAAQIAYIKAFCETRRMTRDAAKAEQIPDPIRAAVGLPVGRDGGYFVGGAGFMGQDRDASVIESNTPPAGQPSLWCQWVSTEDGLGIEWDEGEKFYEYEEWLNYMIEHFLKPWGIEISGHVEFQGEEPDDFGFLAIKDGHAMTLKGKRVMPKL